MTIRLASMAAAWTAFAGLAFSPILQAQDISIIIPRTVQDSATITGIAFANPSDDFAEVNLQLLDIFGLPVALSDTLVLPPHSQIARNADELFGLQQIDGWVAAGADNIQVVGFFLTYSPDVDRIDGADGLLPGQPSQTVVFPEILAGAGEFTDLTVLGFAPDGQSYVLLFELIGADGAVLATAQRTLPPFPSIGSQVREQVVSLFPGPLPAAGYVRVSGNGAALLGYEEFGDANSSGGRNAIPVFSQPVEMPGKLFGAQFAETSALTSVVTLINPTDVEATVQLTATPTGVANPQNAVTVERTLPAGGILRQSGLELFGFSGEFVGWVQVDAPFTGLVGDITFGGTDGELLSSVQLQSIPLSDFVYSQVAQAPTAFTGITFLNPGDEAADVDVEIFDEDGLTTGQSQFVLQGREHRPRVLPEIVPGFQDQSGGHIRVRSTREIYSFELFGFTSGPAVASLTAVPPQRGAGRIEGKATFGGGEVAGAGAGALPAIPVYVVAIDPGTGVVQQTHLADGPDLEYEMTIPSGRYLIAAGTDIGEDGTICEPEAIADFCGYYVLTQEPSEVVVTAGEDTTDIDVAMNPNAELKGKTGRPKGGLALRASATSGRVFGLTAESGQDVRAPRTD